MTLGSPDHPTSLRERNKARTREELGEVARRLFAERGFDEVTIEEVAEASGVSRRTFFRYFDSKEDVLLADNSSMLDRLAAALASRPAGEPAFTSVRHAMLSLTADYEANKARMLVGARIMAGTPSVMARALEQQVRWEAVIAAHVAAKLSCLPTDLTPRVVAASAIAATRAAIDAWLATGGEANLPELAERALDLLGGGHDRISGVRRRS